MLFCSFKCDLLFPYSPNLSIFYSFSLLIASHDHLVALPYRHLVLYFLIHCSPPVASPDNFVPVNAYRVREAPLSQKAYENLNAAFSYARLPPMWELDTYSGWPRKKEEVEEEVAPPSEMDNILGDLLGKNLPPKKQTNAGDGTNADAVPKTGNNAASHGAKGQPSSQPTNKGQITKKGEGGASTGTGAVAQGPGPPKVGGKK